VTESTKVIAHFFKASRQILSDFPQLASIINQRGLYGLKLVEENQLLNGDGTGQNLSGLVANSTAYAAPFDPAGTETGIDVIRLAMLQVVLAEYAADGIVMHPSDWTRLELLKDTTGRYIIGNPQGTIAPTLWGLPVIATPAMTVDKFMVGCFQQGATLYDRMSARVEISTEVARYFDTIHQQVHRLDQLVAEIATASSEQSSGLGQLNSTVAAMDKVTQQNAASAEESAAAAEIGRASCRERGEVLVGAA